MFVSSINKNLVVAIIIILFTSFCGSTNTPSLSSNPQSNGPVATVPTPVPYEIVEHYDKFKEITFVNLEETSQVLKDDQGLYFDVELGASFLYGGKTRSGSVDKITLTIYVTSASLNPSTSHNLIIIADGKRFDYSDVDLYDVDIRGGRITEKYMKLIPYSAFHRISRSKDIEMQLDFAESTVPNDTISR